MALGVGSAVGNIAARMFVPPRSTATMLGTAAV
jgi:hypothetical protein